MGARSASSARRGFQDLLKRSLPPGLRDSEALGRRLADLERVKWEVADKLFSIKNVCGVGVGFRQREGKERFDQDPVLRVYVSRKYRSGRVLDRRDLPDLRKQTWLPRGDVDVIQKRFYAAAGPVRGAASVAPLGHKNCYGTLGIVCRDISDGHPVALSAWHVLTCARIDLPIGTPIVMPPGSQDTVARLKRWMVGNGVDAAIAEIEPPSRARVGELPGGFRINGIRDIEQEGFPRLLYKCGSVTNWSRGYLSDASYSGTYVVRDNFGRRQLVALHNGFVVGPVNNEEVSMSGDSGALWVDENSRAVGLHVAGDADNDRVHEYGLGCWAATLASKMGVTFGP